MTGPWRSLRVRLAVLGFLAGYVPVLLLFGVILVTDTETMTIDDTAGTETTTVAAYRSPVAVWTLIILAPAAAIVAWWWAGRAVRPLEHMHTRLADAAETQRRLVEETSHELRVPLAVLANNAEVLLAHPNPTIEVYRDGLVRSGRAAERMRVTIDELLVDARGRARTIDRHPADLMVLARGVADDLRHRAVAKQLNLRVTGQPAAVSPVDEPSVRRAVSNLLDNAIRHAPPGSEVEVAVEPAAIVVTDHGPGIPAAEQERIFERFWHGDQPGTGLGLPIANQIALAHGGSLTVVSPGPAGDGCVFRLEL